MSPDFKDQDAGEQVAEERDAGGDTAPPSLSDLRIYAGRLLARREFAVAELRARLERRYSADESVRDLIRELLESLQQEGALSDLRFTESFIRSRLNRFHGPIKIRAQLRERHVPENIIESSLAELGEEWVPLAAAWVSRHGPGTLDFAQRAKYHRRLVNRGFSHQQANAALSEAASSH